MTDLLTDLITYFAQQGVVQGDGIDAFRDTAPDSPDSMVVIYEYVGSPIAGDTDAAERSLQIVARAHSATEAKLKAREIHKLIRVQGLLQVTAERWVQIIERQLPFKIKVDSNGRVYYGFNVGVITYKD